MLRKITVALFICIGIATAINAQPHVADNTPLASAQDVVDAACKQAKKENKKVFISFTASWCGWCKKMKAIMESDAVKQYFTDNYEIRYLVAGERDKTKDNPGAIEMKDQKFNGANQGIPFWVVLDANGKLLYDSKLRKEGEGPAQGSNVGCPAQESEIGYFIKVLKNTSKLNEKQLEEVAVEFGKILKKQ